MPSATIATPLRPCATPSFCFIFVGLCASRLAAFCAWGERSAYLHPWLQRAVAFPYSQMHFVPRLYRTKTRQEPQRWFSCEVSKEECDAGIRVEDLGMKKLWIETLHWKVTLPCLDFTMFVLSGSSCVSCVMLKHNEADRFLGFLTCCCRNALPMYPMSLVQKEHKGTWSVRHQHLQRCIGGQLICQPETWEPEDRWGGHGVNWLIKIDPCGSRSQACIKAEEWGRQHGNKKSSWDQLNWKILNTYSSDFISTWKTLPTLPTLPTRMITFEPQRCRRHLQSLRDLRSKGRWHLLVETRWNMLKQCKDVDYWKANSIPIFSQLSTTWVSSMQQRTQRKARSFMIAILGFRNTKRWYFLALVQRVRASEPLGCINEDESCLRWKEESRTIAIRRNYSNIQLCRHDTKSWGEGWLPRDIQL